MEAIYRKKYIVHVNDIDFRSQLKLSSLFVYLQDMATEHAFNIGVGRDVLMAKYGIIWVLNRVVVEIIRHPVFKEEIIIETWPEQPDKVLFNRNFLVWDKEGNVLVKAFSQWVVIDYETRKLKRAAVIEEGFPKIDKERPVATISNKIKPIGQLNLSYKKTVGYSDIDINEHLNNARYIDYIMDCFSMDFHKKHKIKSIQIDYLHEALPGETIQLYTDSTSLKDNSVYIEGFKENTNTTTFKALITLSP